MSKSGSISSVPARPLGALLFALPSTITLLTPDTSTKPPSPDSLPPLTSIVASSQKIAVSSEKIITSPPLPLAPGFAVVRLPGAKTINFEAYTSISPPSLLVASACIVPRCPTLAAFISIFPLAELSPTPFAEITASVLLYATCVACISTPPAALPSLPSAVIVPSFIIRPLDATSDVVPSASSTQPSSIRVSKLTTWVIMSVMLSVGIRTVPGVEPSGGVVISKFMRFLPSKFMVNSSAAPTATFPRFATMRPSFDTSGAARTA